MAVLFPWCVGPAAAFAVAPFVPPLAVPATPPVTLREVPVHVPAEDALRVAQKLLRAGDLEDALLWLDRALADDPDLHVAHLGRALCLAQLGRDEESGDALECAILAAGDDPALPLQLASMSARAGQTALAMGLLEVAIGLAPESGELALKDPAFAGLRDHPRFLMICGAL